ncbi:uncharacterized protein LOC120456360 isoform X2 [Drosophila santomea]|uniref:uncharacterized protein LOC120456360 isoform X2 n=1 Tax=Drosophila santomea TaxID=129105 RepID=UPI001953A380|nr:uncharacterized protein LOC120456360 isoform X2 [Drosophila santomea]
MDSQLTALQNKLASIEVALTSLQDKLASIEVALDAQARNLANNEQNFTKRLNGLESRLSDQEEEVLKGSKNPQRTGPLLQKLVAVWEVIWRTLRTLQI